MHPNRPEKQIEHDSAVLVACNSQCLFMVLDLATTP